MATKDPQKPSSKPRPSGGRQLPTPPPRQQHNQQPPRRRPHKAAAATDDEALSSGVAAVAHLLDAPDAELPAPPDQPPSRLLALREIDPDNPFQKRRFPLPDAKNPYILKLAASIRKKGVVIPILVRVLEDGTYKLLAGECRFRASCLNLPSLDEIGPPPLYIPAILLHNLSDSEAASMTAIENLNRNNLLPFEEVETVAMLLPLHGGDPNAVARELGQDPAWVARRARVHTHLAEAWKQSIAENDSAFWSWTIQHLEEVAKLGAADQAALLQRLQDYSDTHLTVHDLRREVSELTLRLDRAPFDLLDETLVPEAGSCANCQDNTFTNPLLFDEDAPTATAAELRNARCLSRACFLGKCHASIERNTAAFRQDHPDLVLVRTTYEDPQFIPPSLRSETLPPGSFDKVPKKTSGARPALVVHGPGSGKQIWIAPDHSMLPAAPPERTRPAVKKNTDIPASGPDPDVKRQKHLNRRISLLTGQTRALVKEFDGATLPPHTLLALALAIGTSRSARSTNSYSSTPWVNFHRSTSLESEPLARELWKDQIMPVLASRLEYNGPDDTDRLLLEIRESLTLIGQDPDALFREVARKLPEPKSWFTDREFVGEVVANLSLPVPSAEFLARDARIEDFSRGFAQGSQEPDNEAAGDDDELNPPLERDRLQLDQDEQGEIHNPIHLAVPDPISTEAATAQF